MPGVFGDHMVLQRDRPVRFRGRAGSGKRVAVRIGDTVTGLDGGWQLLFPPTPAGGPHTVTVHAVRIIWFTGVMFGGVRLAGGQSNMEWKIGWGINRQQAEIGASDYPAIRYQEIPDTLAPCRDLPLIQAGGRWLLKFFDFVSGLQVFGEFRERA